ERLLEAGVRVLALHPNQVKAARDRFRASGGKSDGSVRPHTEARTEPRKCPTRNRSFTSRSVLLHADGAAVPRDRARARARDATYRPADLPRHGARVGAREPRRARR